MRWVREGIGRECATVGALYMEDRSIQWLWDFRSKEIPRIGWPC